MWKMLLGTAVLAGCSSRPAPPAAPEGSSPAVIALPDDAPPPPPARSLYATGTKTIGARSPANEAPPPAERRIDLDVKSADIHDVCRLLAEVGGVSIVVADDVRGAVTVRMKGVPWDQALATIVEMKGYRIAREGNVITVVAR